MAGGQVNKPSPGTVNSVLPGRKEAGSGAANGAHNLNNENLRRASTRLVCIPEYHERSYSCPTLHTANSALRSPGDAPTFSRNTPISNQPANQHLSSLPHESTTGAHSTSAQISSSLLNMSYKDADHHMHMISESNKVKTNHANDVVMGWMSSPRGDSKTATITAPIASFANHSGSQNTRDSSKALSELTSQLAENWKRVSTESSSHGASHYPNHNNSNMENMAASGASRTADVGHEESNAMEEYEYDRHPSQTARASLASSTTSSETTTTRMSDSGSVTKRRSISAPKREYRCTKKDGCDAVFSCNSLRK